MTRRCRICNQPITNTPYHFREGNRDRCQKHCNCRECDRPDDGADSLLGLPATILATELVTDALLGDPSPSTDVPSDPGASTDFGGFGGGASGGGGAGGDF